MPQWHRILQSSQEVSSRQSRLVVAAVACAHIAGAWALMQVPAVRDAVRQAAPMMFDLVVPAPPPAPDPPRPPPPPPPPLPRPLPAPAPAPILAAPQAAAPAEATFAAEPPPVEPVVTEPPVAVAAPAPPAPPAPSPPPPPRRVVPATAVQYLALPPVEVPRLSRRARESGTVVLRVVVDVRGMPAQVHVQRSSGFARLDEQAVWAMRQARFKPQTEDGTPIELEVTAPIEYLLD